MVSEALNSVNLNAAFVLELNKDQIWCNILLSEYSDNLAMLIVSVLEPYNDKALKNGAAARSRMRELLYVA